MQPLVLAESTERQASLPQQERPRQWGWARGGGSGILLQVGGEQPVPLRNFRVRAWPSAFPKAPPLPRLGPAMVTEDGAALLLEKKTPVSTHELWAGRQNNLCFSKELFLYKNSCLLK